MIFDLRTHRYFASIKKAFEDKYIEHPNGCWYWMAAVRPDGYGAFNCRDATVQAYRASWRIYKGPLPDGLMLRHTCDERLCVNPNHLIPGTHADNMRDMVERNRQTFGEKNPQAFLTEEKVKAIHADPRTQSEIAEAYGVTTSTVSTIKTGSTWKHLGLEPHKRPVRTKGEKHGMSKLTEEIVRYIRQSPLSGKALSKELGFSHSTVCRARKGDTWRL